MSGPSDDTRKSLFDNEQEKGLQVSAYLEADRERAAGIEEEKGLQQIAGLIADRRLRVGMAVTLTLLFVLLNGVVIWLVMQAVEADRSMISAKLIEPAQRLISENVYMSLIGATVVQLSSILFAIARYLFPPGANRE